MQYLNRHDLVDHRRPLQRVPVAMIGARVLECMTESDRDLLFPGEVIRGCVADRVHFGSKLGIVIEYVFVLEGERSIRAFGQLPWGDPKATFDKAMAKLEAGLSGRVGTGPRIALVGRLGLILRAPGFDERIDDLAALTAYGMLTEALVPEIERFWGGDRVAIELLSHRLGKRAVLRISGAQDAGETTRAILKLYKRGTPVAATAASTQRKLAERLSNDVAVVRVPTILGELTERSAVLMADAPGASLRSLIGVQRERGMQSAGHCIAALHSSRLGDIDPYTPSHEWDLLSNWITFIAEISQRQSAIFSRALARVRADLCEVGGSMMVPIHRDFHEHQVICNGASATLIDFDTIRLGDPAQDIGNFLAHLHFADLQADALRVECADALLDGYRLGARAGLNVSQRNIDTHRRATLLRLALMNWFSERYRHLVEPLLDEVNAP